MVLISYAKIALVFVAFSNTVLADSCEHQDQCLGSLLGNYCCNDLGRCCTRATYLLTRKTCQLNTDCPTDSDFFYCCSRTKTCCDYATFKSQSNSDFNHAMATFVCVTFFSCMAVFLSFGIWKMISDKQNTNNRDRRQAGSNRIRLQSNGSQPNEFLFNPTVNLFTTPIIYPPRYNSQSEITSAERRQIDAFLGILPTDAGSDPVEGNDDDVTAVNGPPTYSPPPLYNGVDDVAEDGQEEVTEPRSEDSVAGPSEQRSTSGGTLRDAFPILGLSGTPRVVRKDLARGRRNLSGSNRTSCFVLLDTDDDEMLTASVGEDAEAGPSVTSDNSSATTAQRTVRASPDVSVISFRAFMNEETTSNVNSI